MIGDKVGGISSKLTV